jgi:hypothetical protein
MLMTPTEEIRAIRHELAARFDNDLVRIVADLQRQQRDSGREYVTLAKRPPRRISRVALHRDVADLVSGQ